MPKIIAVSGRKQSGKSSLCAYIEAALTAYAYKDEDEDVREGAAKYKAESHFKQRPDGIVEWEWGSTKDGVCVGPGAIDGLVKVYNFADSLKDVCVNVLGILPEQCYGTDEQKNSLTKFKWENLPETVRLANANRSWCPETVHGGRGPQVPIPRMGYMTAREVMQVFGTDVMRKMFCDSVWVNTTVNRINKENRDVALVADMRFRSEFAALYEAGAYVIRLERKITHDTHSSETDFDGFDWTPYERVLVIPAEMGIHDKNKLAHKWLKKTVGLDI